MINLMQGEDAGQVPINCYSVNRPEKRETPPHTEIELQHAKMVFFWFSIGIMIAFVVLVVEILIALYHEKTTRHRKEGINPNGEDTDTKIVEASILYCNYLLLPEGSNQRIGREIAVVDLPTSTTPQPLEPVAGSSRSPQDSTLSSKMDPSITESRPGNAERRPSLAVNPSSYRTHPEQSVPRNKNNRVAARVPQMVLDSMGKRLKPLSSREMIAQANHVNRIRKDPAQVTNSTKFVETTDNRSPHVASRSNKVAPAPLTKVTTNAQTKTESK